MANRKAISLLALAALAAVASGCGPSSQQRTSELRPPAPALVSAALTEDGILLSPTRIGGGPVTLAVTNESGTRHRVTFSSASEPGSGTADSVGDQSASLPPGINALLRANLEPGSAWSVSVEDGSLEPQTLYVGPERPSSQNDLMLP